MAKSTVLMPYNGERYFWQWDIGRKLIVNDAECCEVHFCNKSSDCALVCKVYEYEGKRVVDVPNILLQTAKPITAFTYVVADDGRITTNSGLYKVVARNKPDVYVYTETEVLNYSYLDARLKDLEGEGIANAVADYLKENPAQAGATAEEAAQIEQNKQDIENLSNEKLDASKLPEAVNEALAQAKASGEFDGQNGSDYVLTDADKQEIAEQAAQLVDAPNVEVDTSAVTEIKSILTDIVTFLKAVPFDDTVASASDLDAIQSKIDALGAGGGTDEPEQPDEPDEPTQTVSATFSNGVLAISGMTANSATFNDGVLAVV